MADLSSTTQASQSLVDMVKALQGTTSSVQAAFLKASQGLGDIDQKAYKDTHGKLIPSFQPRVLQGQQVSECSSASYIHHSSNLHCLDVVWIAFWLSKRSKNNCGSQRLCVFCVFDPGDELMYVLSSSFYTRYRPSSSSYSDPRRPCRHTAHDCGFPQGWTWVTLFTDHCLLVELASGKIFIVTLTWRRNLPRNLPTCVDISKISLGHSIFILHPRP